MNISAHSNDRLNLKIYILIAAILLPCFYFPQQVARFIILTTFIIFILAKKPISSLSFFIILIPLSGTELLSGYLIKMPGLKTLNLSAVLVLTVIILFNKERVRIPNLAVIFIFVIIGFFSISFIRSIPNLNIIKFFFSDGNNLSVLRYILSYYVQPLIYFMPFILFLKLSKNVDDLTYFMQVIAISIFILSLFLLYIYVFIASSKGSLKQIETVYYNLMGMHRNGLADFYILGFPIILANFFLKRNLFNTLNIFFCFVAVGFLYSRTAYFIFIISPILYLFISNRKKYYPILFYVAIVFSFFISTSIIERASRGIASKDMEIISAGRLHSIWIPLINEYFSNPLKLLFGKGNYAIWLSDSIPENLKFSVGHGHNLYLETLLNTGMIGMIIIIFLFFSILHKIYVAFKNEQNPILKECQCGIFISLVSYFIAGLTGRSLFPDFLNAYLWIILSFAILTLKISNERIQNGTLTSNSLTEPNTSLAYLKPRYPGPVN